MEVTLKHSASVYFLMIFIGSTIHSVIRTLLGCLNPRCSLQDTVDGITKRYIYPSVFVYSLLPLIPLPPRCLSACPISFSLGCLDFSRWYLAFVYCILPSWLLSYTVSYMLSIDWISQLRRLSWKWLDVSPCAHVYCVATQYHTFSSRVELQQFM